jgi:hypothetical protein
MLTVLERVQQFRPDIQFPIAKPSPPKRYPVAVREMIADLIQHIPGISISQLSDVTGMKRETISGMIDDSIPRTLPPNDEQIENPPPSFEIRSANHLNMLRRHHSSSGYRDDPRALAEPVLSTIAHNSEKTSPHAPATRKADQSHTVARPITLATTPFNWRD